MKFRDIILLSVSYLFLSCSYKANNTIDSVQLIFVDTPDQLHTLHFGHTTTSNEIGSISYIDLNGNVVYYNPNHFGKDTLHIPTIDGYIEIKYVYQAIEDRYYKLKAGDVVEVYHNGYAPYFTSVIDTTNTRLYNLLYEHNSPLMHSTGFTLNTVINDVHFNASYRYFNDSELQRRYPSLKDKFAAYYYDLDSLQITYRDRMDQVTKIVESMSIAEEYREFYLNTIGATQLDIRERLNDSLLLHQISNLDIILSYPRGKTIPQKFNYVLDDTMPSTLAKRQILRHYLNNSAETLTKNEIRDLFDLYVEHFGDSISKDTSLIHLTQGRYDISAIDLNLEEVDIDKVIQQNQGKLIFLDIWASWCEPCRYGIRSLIDKSTLISDNELLVIYLSIDSNINNWIKGVESMGIPQNNCYLITNKTKSNILQQIKIKEIPRYLIITPDGKLLYDNIPSPKGKDFIMLLEDIVEQYS